MRKRLCGCHCLGTKTQNVLRLLPKTLAANYFKASLFTGKRQDAQHQAKLEGTNDARTGMPHGIPRGAMCVQRFDDSLNSAIHTTYRISLRSSSMPEPRDPLLKVLTYSVQKTQRGHKVSRVWVTSGGRPRGAQGARWPARRSNG